MPWIKNSNVGKCGLLWFRLDRSPADCLLCHLSSSWMSCWTRGTRSWTLWSSSPSPTLCWFAGSAAGRTYSDVGLTGSQNWKLLCGFSFSRRSGAFSIPAVLPLIQNQRLAHSPAPGGGGRLELQQRRVCAGRIPVTDCSWVKPAQLNWVKEHSWQSCAGCRLDQ